MDFYSTICRPPQSLDVWIRGAAGARCVTLALDRHPCLCIFTSTPSLTTVDLVGLFHFLIMWCSIAAVGRVYVGQVKHSRRLPVKSRVALKKIHVTKHVKNPVLLHEAAALLMLKGMLLV